MDNEVYTSAQVSQRISVSAGTIRSWKARKPEQLLEGVHWMQHDGQTLWTETGVVVLQQLSESATGSVAGVQQSALQGAAGNVAGVQQVALQDRYSPLVDAVADALTPGLLQQVDQRVMHNLQKAIAAPMTSAECVAILNELGLKPIDPVALLHESFNAGLLSGSDQDDHQ